MFVQMYGRYTKDLGEYAKEEARRLKYQEKARRKYDRTEDLRKSRRGPLCRKILAFLAFLWKHTGARLGEDWVFLALLGIIMALISYSMDRGISMCNNGQSAVIINLIFQKSTRGSVLTMISSHQPGYGCTRISRRNRLSSISPGCPCPCVSFSFPPVSFTLSRRKVSDQAFRK